MSELIEHQEQEQEQNQNQKKLSFNIESFDDLPLQSSSSSSSSLTLNKEEGNVDDDDDDDETPPPEDLSKYECFIDLLTFLKGQDFLKSINDLHSPMTNSSSSSSSSPSPFSSDEKEEKKEKKEKKEDSCESKTLLDHLIGLPPKDFAQVMEYYQVPLFHPYSRITYLDVFRQACDIFAEHEKYNFFNLLKLNASSSVFVFDAAAKTKKYGELEFLQQITATPQFSHPALALVMDRYAGYLAHNRRIDEMFFLKTIHLLLGAFDHRRKELGKFMFAIAASQGSARAISRLLNSFSQDVFSQKLQQGGEERSILEDLRQDFFSVLFRGEITCSEWAGVFINKIITLLTPEHKERYSCSFVDHFSSEQMIQAQYFVAQCAIDCIDENVLTLHCHSLQYLAEIWWPYLCHYYRILDRYTSTTSSSSSSSSSPSSPLKGEEKKKKEENDLSDDEAFPYNFEPKWMLIEIKFPNYFDNTKVDETVTSTYFFLKHNLPIMFRKQLILSKKSHQFDSFSSLFGPNSNQKEEEKELPFISSSSSPSSNLKKRMDRFPVSIQAFEESNSSLSSSSSSVSIENENEEENEDEEGKSLKRQRT